MENELSGFLKVKIFCHSLSQTSFSIGNANQIEVFSRFFQHISLSLLFLQSQKDPGTVDRIMKDLDANGDGEVNFEEFVSLVVGLSIACEACYREQLAKPQSWNL